MRLQLIIEAEGDEKDLDDLTRWIFDDACVVSVEGHPMNEDEDKT